MLLALALPGRATEAAPSASPFVPGERLTYQVSWSIFPAGEVTATLEQVPDRAGDSYEVQTTARSRGFVSLLFNLNDSFRSIFDPQTLCSRRIEKRINEGHRHKQTEIVFDGVRQLAVLDERDLAKPGHPDKHAENAIPPCVEDIISAFYYLRRQPLRVGDEIRFPVNDGAKTHRVVVEVQARELVRSPLGNRFAFRVEPKVFGDLYKKKGRMLIWFSDDSQRLPLRIKAMMLIGDISGTLQSVSTAPPSSTPP